MHAVWRREYENLNLYYENILTISNHVPAITSNDNNNGFEKIIYEEKKEIEVILNNEENPEILSEKLISLAHELTRF